MSPHPQDPPGSGGWTPERVARLEQLWRDGVSASQAAARLGVTRNAVIGKVHRLGLSQHGAHARAAGAVAPTRRSHRPRTPSKSRPVAAAGSSARARPVKAAGVRSKAAELEVELPPLAWDLAALTPRQCRWPIGDPRAPDFGFCGRPCVGGPYCASHAARAFRGRGKAPPAGRPAGAGA
ncbi:GcrA family cell cycle regulator [Phenylobacterium deserti]|uniref:GcrA cell cycle regulator n=1 Tax=Phenylobacterium deserti TaxID=1914756 RepID=A0A328AD98_9CAUL|nr:GcrA family cell cycle regulator [Phenylobacterium deserti]RAK52621.1 GcrA cell cycle regulator [Phenylobacterium deserti]